MRAVVAQEAEFFSLYNEMSLPDEGAPEVVRVGDVITMFDTTGDGAGDVEFRVLGMFIDGTARGGTGVVRVWVEQAENATRAARVAFAMTQPVK